MTVRVNGEPVEVPEGTTVQGLLEILGIAGRRIAVAVNGEVVPSGSLDERTLQEGDEVELVYAVGGG